MRPTVVSLMRDETYDLVFAPRAEEMVSSLATFRRYRGAAPVIAGPAGAVTKRMSLYMAEKLECFFRGEPLRKPVTRDMLGHIA